MLKPQAAVILPFITLRERFTKSPRARQPEPMLMDDPAAVAEFHAAGTGDGPLICVHEMITESMSHLLPESGTVLDLGCGSGRLLARLARHRPDIRITGFDLSEPMLDTAREMILSENLNGRIELAPADITDFSAMAPDDVSLVSCNLALHHLPTRAHLVRCLDQISSVRRRTGCAVWLSDFARMHHERSILAFMGLIRGGTDQKIVIRDGIMSEAAAWSFDELTEAVHATRGMNDLVNIRMRLLPSYQAHWCFAANSDQRAPSHLWRPMSLSLAARVETATMRIGLRGIP